MLMLVFAMVPLTWSIDAAVAVDAALLGTLPSSCSDSCLTVDNAEPLLFVEGPGLFSSLIADLPGGSVVESLLSSLLAVLRWLALLRRRRLAELLPDSEPDLETPAGLDELAPIWNVVA